MKLDELNALGEEQAIETLLRCCGSRRWASSMAACRPFWDNQVVYNAAEIIWQYLQPHDWLEAFVHHPKIGDLSAMRRKFATTMAWAEGEQSGIHGASEDVLNDLVLYNRQYEEKFGYIFIVCATGKSADEMLELLKSRIDNHPAEELSIAAGEQMKITRLRLEKLLAPV